MFSSMSSVLTMSKILSPRKPIAVPPDINIVIKNSKKLIRLWLINKSNIVIKGYEREIIVIPYRSKSRKYFKLM